MHLDRDIFERGARLFDAGYLIFWEGIPFIEGMIFSTIRRSGDTPRAQRSFKKGWDIRSGSYREFKTLIIFTFNTRGPVMSW